MQVEGDSLGTTVLRVFDDTFHTVLSPPGVTEVWFQVFLEYGFLYVVVHPQDALQRDQWFRCCILTERPHQYRKCRIAPSTLLRLLVKRNRQSSTTVDLPQ